MTCFCGQPAGAQLYKKPVVVGIPVHLKNKIGEMLKQCPSDLPIGLIDFKSAATARLPPPVAAAARRCRRPSPPPPVVAATRRRHRPTRGLAARCSATLAISCRNQGTMSVSAGYTVEK